MAGGGTPSKVVQITNIAPQATKDQMQNLFGNIGKIDEIRLYPTIRDVSCPVYSRICYVKFLESSCVAVAQHMTNTVFIDRALIVCAVPSGYIPDEYTALEITKNGTTVPGLLTTDSNLPPDVINRIDGVHPNQYVTTSDPKLEAHNLPPYPQLPANYDARKIEEIRRTIVVLDVLPHWQLDDMMNHFSRLGGEVKYARLAESATTRCVLMEFNEQKSVSAALRLQGTEYNGGSINVFHSTVSIIKPEAKSNEAAQREIEEAMNIVKEAQQAMMQNASLAEANHHHHHHHHQHQHHPNHNVGVVPALALLNHNKDPKNIGLLSLGNNNSNIAGLNSGMAHSGSALLLQQGGINNNAGSGSRSRRSRTRSRSPRRRSHSHSRSKRSKSRSKRSRSRSKQRSSRRSRSRSKQRSSRRSRSRSKKRSRSRSKRHSSPSTSSRSKRSRSRKRSKSRSKRSKSRTRRDETSRSKRSPSKTSRSKHRDRSRSKDRRKRSRSPRRRSSSRSPGAGGASVASGSRRRSRSRSPRDRKHRTRSPRDRHRRKEEKAAARSGRRGSRSRSRSKERTRDSKRSGSRAKDASSSRSSKRQQRSRSSDAKKLKTIGEESSQPVRDYDEEEKIGSDDAGPVTTPGGGSEAAGESAPTTAEASPEQAKSEESQQQQQRGDDDDQADDVQQQQRPDRSDDNDDEDAPIRPTQHDDGEDDDNRGGQADDDDEARFRPPEPVRKSSASPERSDNMDISNSP